MSFAGVVVLLFSLLPLGHADMLSSPFSVIYMYIGSSAQLTATGLSPLQVNTQLNPMYHLLAWSLLFRLLNLVPFPLESIVGQHKNRLDEQQIALIDDSEIDLIFGVKWL